MKMRNLVIAIVIAVIALLIIVALKIFYPGRTAENAVQAEQDKVMGKAAVTVPGKKTFQKGMGGLTVKAKNSKGIDMNVRIKAFRSDSGSSGVFVSSFPSLRMQELSPGNYDIELDTVPLKIYKNIKISEGKETVKDLGALTGMINVKVLNSKKKDTYVLLKITYPGSNLLVATSTTNRPLEIIPGVYDIGIEMLPRQVKNDVKVEGGKDTIVDLGVVSGALNIKTADEGGKSIRIPARVKNAGTDTIVTSGMTNTSMELAPGTYDVEIMSTPLQVKKAVKITLGEEANVEFLVKLPTPPAPAKTQGLPAKSPAPVKKK